MTSEVKMPVVAYLTNDEEGSPAMLFFDWAEAAEYTYEADPPQALILQSDALAAIEAARVEARAKALEDCRAACDDLSEPDYFGYENPNTWQDGKRACVDAIEALAAASMSPDLAAGGREGVR